MNLLYYPNKMLETKCELVTEFNTELFSILDNMTSVMLKHNGLGLSANQVGINKRILLVKAKDKIYELINPVIIEVTDNVMMQEGCLSSPGIFLSISRPAQVLFQYQDRTGGLKKAMAEDIEARIILHECEHLEGKFFLQNVNRAERKLALSKLKKQLK